MSAEPEFDVDEIIDKLLDVRGARPGKEVNLPESQIKQLIEKAKDVLMNQPVLLNLQAPIKVCGRDGWSASFVGDIHGQYYDLLRLFEYGGFPPESNYLFLG